MTTRDELWAAVHRRKAEHAAGQPITPAPWEDDEPCVCMGGLRDCIPPFGTSGGCSLSDDEQREDER
jgi:hypothetical protein